MELLALAGDNRFLKAQRSYFERQNVRFVPYTGKDQLGDYPGLMIFIPIEYLGQFVSPTETWRRYLARHHPKTRLIIAGVEVINHPNYLDLLALPEDFSVFFHNLKVVTEADWQPIITEAVDMQDKLHRFYEGHGNESVTYTLSKIRRKMETLAGLLKETNYIKAWKEIFEPLPGEAAAYTEGKWNELVRRWAHYAPFFHYLPFREEIEEVGRRIALIAPFFRNNCREEELYIRLEPKKNIDWIFDTLNTIKRGYVS